MITSSTTNPVWTQHPSSTSSKTSVGCAIVPANEEVIVWDIKTGDRLSRWKDESCKAEVTVIEQSKLDQNVFAVGYSDGSIRIWDWKTAQAVISFNGHRSAVTTLEFDHSGTRLASGGKDAAIIVWDLIAEVGLYKLKGHKDQVTKVQFLRGGGALDGAQDEEIQDTVEEASDEDGYLISTSKDTLIKLWELSTQHCIETHVAHHGECWGMTLSPDKRGLITIGNDGEMKVWAIDLRGLTGAATTIGDTHCLLDRGYLYRSSKDRGVMVTFHPSSNFIAAHGTDKSVEIWRIRTGDEIKRVLKRKRKRAAGKGKEATNGEADATVDDISSAKVEDIFTSYVVLRAGGKVRGIDWAVKPGKSSSVQLLVSLANNSLELYDIPKPLSSKEKKKAPEIPDYKKSHSIDLAGHRSDVRALALSSDDRMLASASSDSLKVWNVRTSTCIRTFECGYSLCCSFLPGDKIVRLPLPPY